MNPSPEKLLLTPDDLDCFLKQGYVLLKNVVPPEQIAEAVAFLEAGTYRGDVGAANFRPPQGDAVEACMNDTVFGAIRAIFGDDYPFAEHRGTSDMARPYQEGRLWKSQTVHVDDDYPTLMPGSWALGLFLFLTKVRSHGGAFQFAPGSPFRYREAALDRPEALTVLAPRPELSGPVIELLAEPGDLLLFHHLMGHAGSDNVTDPATRHALLARFHPRQRIVPGAKPFAAMSPIEKVNSTRYLRAQGQTSDGAALPDLSQTEQISTALENGFGVPGGILAHTPVLHQGIPHCLFVPASNPTRIYRAPMPGSASAGIEEVLALSKPIHTLHRIERDPGLALLIGHAGSAELWTDTETGELHRTETLAGVAYSSGHYTTDFGSKVARGRVLYYTSSAAPHQLLCAWGSTWHEAFENRQGAVVIEGTPGSAVGDAFVRPVMGEGDFALMLEKRDPDLIGMNSFSRSTDCALFSKAPHLIPSSVFGYIQGRPRQIRVLARARYYWLVTYLADFEGQPRLFMGSIDWEKEPGRLEPIRTAAALSEAFCIVGRL